MRQGHVRSQLVMIATRGQTRIYRNLDEVPNPLRQRLEESTAGPFSAQIVIADRTGEQRLRCLAEELKGAEPAPASPFRLDASNLRLALELALVGALGMTIWALVTLR